MRRHFLFFIFLVLIIVVVLWAVSLSKIRPVLFADLNVCSNKDTPINLSIVGDLLIGKGRAWQQIVGDDYGPDILGDYFETIEQSDLVFANFEGIISKDNKPRPKNLPKSFSIAVDPSVIRFFANFKKIILSFANNHSADYGRDAIEDTIDLLKKSDISYVGIGYNLQESITPRIQELSGTRIAFLAFTDLLPSEYYASEKQLGVSELTESNLKASITLAKQSADFVVVSLHTAKNVGEPFSFWPDSHQKMFYRSAVDYGADLVIGQHPHGLQQVEKYNGKLIFYSLGLFIYDPLVSQRYSYTNPLFKSIQFNGGGILTLKVCKEGIRGFTLTPIRVVYSKEILRIKAASILDKLITKINILQLQDE